MKLFYKATRKEHIEMFDKALAQLLIDEFPMYSKTIELSTFDGIGVFKDPKSLVIARRYDTKVHKSIDWTQTESFDLTGIYLWHRKFKKYVSITLRFHYSSLSHILTDNPSNLRQVFDLNKIKKRALTKTYL